MSATTDPLPDRYRCGYCETAYVVSVLARDCAQRHENERDPGEAATSRGVTNPDVSEADVPKTTNPCSAVIDGERCVETTEVLTFCRFHWGQQYRGKEFTARKIRRPRGSGALRDSDGRKQCARCEEWRPVEDFGPAKRAADGLQSWCSPCSSDYMMLNRYGITRADVLSMVAEQGGCGICGDKVPRNEGFRNGWHVDHDHDCCPGDRTCGQCIRGILCADCNKLIGLAHDSVTRLSQAIQYLRDCELRHEDDE